jgi:putative transposase
LARSPAATEHEMYWSLGNTPFDREHAYREFMAQGVPTAEQARFTEAVLRGRPVGSETFLKPLAVDHAAVVERRPRGRPRKTQGPR